MIRKATPKDSAAISSTYTELLQHESHTVSHTNWQLGVYPTASVAENAIALGTMYVFEEDGEIKASMILNSLQASEYRTIPWLFPADDEKVLVIHTLCIPPRHARRGIGRQMIDFAKSFARDNGYDVIRIDTYCENEPAKNLYHSCGFRLAGSAETVHMGLIFETLVYLEFKL